MAAILGVLGAVSAYLGLFPKRAVPMETCLAKSLERFPGRTIWVEYLTTEHERFYEFEVETTDGHVLNVECNAETGEIVEYSRHASPEDPLFAQAVAITFEKARALALAVKPGRIVSAETYFHNDRTPFYEFDVITPAGKEYKIEIDGTKGEVVAVEDEAWEIGG